MRMDEIEKNGNDSGKWLRMDERGSRDRGLEVRDGLGSC